MKDEMKRKKMIIITESREKEHGILKIKRPLY